MVHLTTHLEHLSCYLLGILAFKLEAFIIPDTELPPKQKEIHPWATHGLAYTCAISYAYQASGLGPDQMKMNKSWEVDKAMYHLEWENRNRREIVIVHK